MSDWATKRAGDLMPGDKTKWGYGRGMENSFRTVSRVEKKGRGIVAIYHRETWEPYHDEYAEGFMVQVMKP